MMQFPTFHQGEIKLPFDQLSAPLYACMVVKLSNPQNAKVYEYLKLVLDAVYQMKKVNKKGHEMACKIEGFIRENSTQSITYKKQKL